MKELEKNRRPAEPPEPTVSDMQERMTELTEHQAAVSEVLSAIASSPHEPRPIFDSIVANAIRLFGGMSGALFLFEELGVRVVAQKGPPNPYLVERHGLAFPVPPRTPLAELVESRSPVHITDLAADPRYDPYDGYIRVLVEVLGARTYLIVPMLKEDDLVGAFSILRDKVQPFTGNQINFIRAFAAEATIALEIARRERRQRQMQIELAHANRVATLGQLTASLAHELKQPLTAVMMNGSSALRWLTSNPIEIEEAKQSVESIIEDANRASDIMGRLRSFIKNDVPQKEALDINGAIVEVLTLVHGEVVRNRVTIETQFADDLPCVQGDRVQLQQVMLNLIVNAIQAMSSVADGQRELRIMTEKVASEGVRVGVRDSGPGLSADINKRLFKPFYTTKPDGMGIGLSICRIIVENHGGRLWSSGHESKGALFQFTIPRNRGR